MPVAVGIAVENEDLAAGLPFLGVKLGVAFLFRKKGGLNTVFGLLGIGRIACTDELLDAEEREVEGEIARKVTPLGIVTGKEDGFSAEYVGVVVYVSLHLLIYVGQLGIELVVFRIFGVA